MAVMNLHHPLAFAFGILGNLVSLGVYLAPVPTFWRIYRKKSTEGFRSLPYIVALFSSMLWLYYAMLKTNALPLITINSLGCLIETIYIAIFLAYAPRESRALTIKLIVSLNVGLFSLILLVTHFLVGSSLRVRVLGYICVAMSVSVFAAPLTIVAQVIRTRSVEFMPFNLSFSLTLSAIVWFAYGLFTKDLCVTLPNVVGFILGLLQMLLYAIYRNASKVEVFTEEKKPPEQLISIVVLGALGISDVHPVDVQLEADEAANENIEQTEPPSKNEKSMEATTTKEQLEANAFSA